MKKFLIKVNGNQYEVEVEEVMEGGYAAPVSMAAPTPAPASAAVSAPAPAAPKPAQAAPNKTAATGSVKITAPMPGTVLGVKVNSGDSVKKGQVLLILEAMKMENEIVAPNDGTIASINVSKGTSVNAGDTLLSMN